MQALAVLPKAEAGECDYILSYARSQVFNVLALVERLSSAPVQGPHGDGPIDYCTALSLGLGGSFRDFERAASQTRHGMLIVSPSPDYYGSAECVRQCGTIPPRRIKIYHQRGDRIVRMADWGAERRTFEPDILQVARTGDAAAVAALCSANGGVANEKDDAGTTALILGARNGHAQVVKALLAARADVLSSVNSGYAAIHAAAQGCRVAKGRCEAGEGHFHSAEALLEAAADITTKSQAGFTPLHFAATSGNPKIVELLIRSRAAVGSKTRRGQTASRLAGDRRDTAIVELLRASMQSR